MAARGAARCALNEGEDHSVRILLSRPRALRSAPGGEPRRGGGGAGGSPHLAPRPHPHGAVALPEKDPLGLLLLPQGAASPDAPLTAADLNNLGGLPGDALDAGGAAIAAPIPGLGSGLEESEADAAVATAVRHRVAARRANGADWKGGGRRGGAARGAGCRGLNQRSRDEMAAAE